MLVFELICYANTYVRHQLSLTSKHIREVVTSIAMECPVYRAIACGEPVIEAMHSAIAADYHLAALARVQVHVRIWFRTITHDLYTRKLPNNITVYVTDALWHNNNDLAKYLIACDRWYSVTVTLMTAVIYHRYEMFDYILQREKITTADLQTLDRCIRGEITRTTVDMSAFTRRVNMMMEIMPY